MNRNRLKKGGLLASIALLAVSLNNMAGASVAEAGDEDLSIASDFSELMIGDNPARLFGVHFPAEAGACGASANSCKRRGLEALQELLTQSESVACELMMVTSRGTRVTQCEASGEELGGWLVAQGWAVADRRVTRRYLSEERAARSAGRGVWENNLLNGSMP